MYIQIYLKFVVPTGTNCGYVACTIARIGNANIFHREWKKSVFAAKCACKSDSKHKVHVYGCIFLRILYGVFDRYVQITHAWGF